MLNFINGGIMKPVPRLASLVLGLAVCSSVVAGPITVAKIVAKGKQAVVQIVAMDKNGEHIKTGTGFSVTADGLLLTNYHVIAGAAYLSARTASGATFRLESVLVRSGKPDLAILKFAATDVAYLDLGSSADAVEGQRVLVIGNPEDLPGTVSEGIISAFRSDRAYIQITAPISPGSSGSPVLDEESGQVIGMATLVYREGQNLNFAISADTIWAYIKENQQQP
jgi:serine protease Do